MTSVFALHRLLPDRRSARPIEPITWAPRHAILTIDLGAVVANYRTLRRQIGRAAVTAVGYGRTATPTEATRLAPVGVGYADGYLRIGGGRGCAWFGDTPLPVLGRVSMDSLVLDAGAVRDPAFGEGAMVEIIGPHRDVDAVGRDLRTTGYEVLTGLGHRYHRRFVAREGSVA